MPITIGQVLESVLNQKLRFLVAFCTILGLVVIGLLLVPKEYGSEGRMFVQLGRHNVGLDPTATTSGTITVNDSRETEIRTITEMLRSHQVLSQVVDRIGAERILQSKYQLPEWLIPSLSSSNSVDHELDLSAEEVSEQQNREKAITKLVSNLKVNSEKKTTVITVYARASSPGLAREISQAVMEAYAALHVSINQVRARGFFEEQFLEEQNKLEQANIALRDFRNLREFLSIDGARNTLQQVIDRLEGQHVDVRVDLSQARERIVQLERELAGLDERIERPTIGVERTSAEGANTELMRLQSELAKTLTSKTASHPRAVEIQSQLDRLQANLMEQPVDRTVTINDYNPVYQQIEVSLIEARSNTEALEARQIEIDRKLIEARHNLKQLNSDQVTSNDLEREIEIRRAYLETYAQKRGEATILDQLDEEKISNVVIAQPASLMLKHVSPRGSVVLPLGLLFAGMAATVISFLTYRSRRDIVVDRGEDLEQQLDLPILITLPRVPTTKVAVR